MLGCKPISTPIEQNYKLYHYLNEATPTDKGRYQKLMGKWIYLCHPRPDIAYVVNVVIQFTHDPRKSHMEVVECILKYLKSASRK